jgi:hypothetical protein
MQNNREIAFSVFRGLFRGDLFKNYACSGLFGLFGPHVEREQA